MPFEETDNITVLILPLLRRNFEMEKVKGDAVVNTGLPGPEQTSPINHSSFIPD